MCLFLQYSRGLLSSCTGILFTPKVHRISCLSASGHPKGYERRGREHLFTNVSGASTGTQTWEAALKHHNYVESDDNDDDNWSITSKTGTNMTGTKLLTSIQCNNSIKEVRRSRVWLHNNHSSTTATKNVKNDSCNQIQIDLDSVKAALGISKRVQNTIIKTNLASKMDNMSIINTTPMCHVLMLHERHPETQTTHLCRLSTGRRWSFFKESQIQEEQITATSFL